jgi:hypothetical protein
VKTAAKAVHFVYAFQDFLIVFNNFLGSVGKFYFLPEAGRVRIANLGALWCRWGR